MSNGFCRHWNEEPRWTHLATFGIVLDSRKGILPKKNVVTRKQVWTDGVD